MDSTSKIEGVAQGPLEDECVLNGDTAWSSALNINKKEQDVKILGANVHGMGAGTMTAEANARMMMIGMRTSDAHTHATKDSGITDLGRSDIGSSASEEDEQDDMPEASNLCGNSSEELEGKQDKQNNFEEANRERDEFTDDEEAEETEEEYEDQYAYQEADPSESTRQTYEHRLLRIFATKHCEDSEYEGIPADCFEHEDSDEDGVASGTCSELDRLDD